jgi:uncharacterized protein (DUF305 family)
MRVARISLLVISALTFACASHKEVQRPIKVARAAEVVEPYDLKFIDSMIHHHQQGVAMAQIAWRKASHDELRIFAKTMADAQRDQVAKLEEWRNAWFEGEASARDAEKDGIWMNTLSKLETTEEEDFDFYFVQAMVEHHENGMAMANDAIEHASRAELKDYAQAMIDEHNDEKRQMNAWARFWM